MNYRLAGPLYSASGMRHRLAFAALFLCASLWLTGCGSVGVREDAEGQPAAANTASANAPEQKASSEPAESESANDPFEGFNRAMYTFNDKFDRYLLKPVAKGYQAVMPEVVRQGVSNFFSNLQEPRIMVNNLLQGKFKNAASDLGRFLVNSTIGIVGLFDFASDMGLDKHDEDFGQTLAKWGVGEGPYLVLPILGPSNIRDGVGLVPDWELHPVSHVEDDGARYSLIAVEVINRRAQLLDAGDILDQAAGEDPYVFVRESYRQRRQSQIYDGNPPAPPVDPTLFEDDDAPPKEKGSK